MNLTKYYLYFKNDLFKTSKMIYISKGDRKNWILIEGSNPSWDYVAFFSIKDKKEIQINEFIFNSLMSLNQMNRYYINKCNHPIELFEKWNLLDSVAEYLI